MKECARERARAPLRARPRAFASAPARALPPPPPPPPPPPHLLGALLRAELGLALAEARESLLVEARALAALELVRDGLDARRLGVLLLLGQHLLALAPVQQLAAELDGPAHELRVQRLLEGAQLRRLPLLHLLHVHAGHGVVLGQVAVPRAVEVRVLAAVRLGHLGALLDVAHLERLDAARLLLLAQRGELLRGARRLLVVALALALGPVRLEDLQELLHLRVGALAQRRRVREVARREDGRAGAGAGRGRRRGAAAAAALGARRQRRGRRDGLRHGHELLEVDAGLPLRVQHLEHGERCGRVKVGR